MPEHGLAGLDVDRFVRLVRIVIENDAKAASHEQSVVVTLRPDDPVSRERVTIRCEGVEDLQLRGASAGELCRLAVEDLADRGWDRLRYQVSDLDEVCISFYGERIEIEEPDNNEMR